MQTTQGHDGPLAITMGSGSSARNIKTTAKQHGVFNSPTTGEILYVDPDHDDEKHHSPLMTAAEAKVAFERGLIDEYDPESDRVKAETTLVPADPNAIGTVAAKRTERFAEEDDKGGAGSGSLDSRSSTAWPDRARVEGGVEGANDGVPRAPVEQPADIDADSGDDDAAPAPKPRGRKPASAGE